MAQTAKIKEGEFFYLPKSGVVMAHYPKQGSKHAKEFRGSLLLAPLAYNLDPVKATKATLEKLQETPSTEDCHAANRAMYQIERGTTLTDDLIEELLTTDQLEDIGRLARLVSPQAIASKKYKELTERSISIIASVYFYHDVIAKDPKKKRLLTAGSAKEKHKQSFAAAARFLQSQSGDIEKALDAEGERVVVYNQTKPTEEPAPPANPQSAEPQTAAKKETVNTQDQIDAVESALKRARGTLGIITEQTAAIERLAVLFEKGKVPFKDTVILLNHAFSQPQENPNNTVAMVNDNDPDNEMTFSELNAAMKKAKKTIKNKFGNSSNPADVALSKAAFDWRPPTFNAA